MSQLHKKAHGLRILSFTLSNPHYSSFIFWKLVCLKNKSTQVSSNHFTNIKHEKVKSQIDHEEEEGDVSDQAMIR